MVIQHAAAAWMVAISQFLSQRREKDLTRLQLQNPKQNFVKYDPTLLALIQIDVKYFK